MNGLLNTRDWLEIRDRRHFDLHLQTNVAVWVNPRGDLDVDADIDVLNCVLTRGFTKPALLVEPTPTPAWKLPVATGTRSPIFNFAGWPSRERTSGF